MILRKHDISRAYKFRVLIPRSSYDDTFYDSEAAEGRHKAINKGIDSYANNMMSSDRWSRFSEREKRNFRIIVKNMRSRAWRNSDEGERIASNTYDIGFSKVSGLTTGQCDIMTYRNGYDKLDYHKEPGLVKVKNIILERGFAVQDAFEFMFAWHRHTMFNMDEKLDIGEQVKRPQDVGYNPDFEDNDSTYFMRNIRISLYDRLGRTKTSWSLSNVWPIELEFSDLDSMDSKVIIERMVLSVHGIDIN